LRIADSDDMRLRPIEPILLRVGFDLYKMFSIVPERIR
jgi:DNA-binding protein H-NS